MNYSELESVRSQWGLDVDGVAKLLGLENGAATYTSWKDATVPSSVASHVETLKVMRSINRGVFNNYIAQVK